MREEKKRCELRNGEGKRKRWEQEVVDRSQFCWPACKYLNNKHCESLRVESVGEFGFPMDAPDVCGFVSSQSMCRSIRSEKVVQLETKPFCAVAENTKLAGE